MQALRVVRRKKKTTRNYFRFRMYLPRAFSFSLQGIFELVLTSFFY